LYGDPRGSYINGRFLRVDEELEEAERSEMVGNPILLSETQRQLIDQAIVEMCDLRKWLLHAKNVRTNHVHVVVTAPQKCKTVLSQLKARMSRLLSEDAGLFATIDSGKNVHTGKRHAFQEIMTTSVSGRTMSLQSRGKAEAPGTPSKAMQSDAFAQAVLDVVAKSPTARLEAFAGDDPQAALPKIDMTPAAPPSGR
jgi:REP element-mobilizing transposase RayT